MSHRLKMIVSLLLAFGPTSLAQAGLLATDFGATGGGPNLSDVNLIPATSATSLSLVFTTSGTDDPLDLCVAGPGCVFGWTGTLTTTGTLRITGYDPSVNSNTASGPGATTCDSSLLPSSTCATNGGNASNGEVGTNVAMFGITLGLGSVGDQLLYTGDFTLSDFSSHLVQNQVLATVVPEPGTAGLLGVGIIVLVLARRRA